MKRHRQIYYQEYAMKKALLFALTMQLSGAALAAPVSDPINEGPKWYQADLIVFRYLDNNSREAWPPVSQHSSKSNALTLKSAAPISKDPLSKNLPSNLLEPIDSNAMSLPVDPVRDAFIGLPASEFLLKNESSKLSRSNRYEVISQMAWRMPIDDAIKEQPVKVKASNNQGNRFLLDGTVTVSTSRYLHVSTNLWLNELAPEALFGEITKQKDALSASGDIAEKGIRSGSLIRLEEGKSPLRITRNFQLKEKRRIKNTTEIQYMDSPVIGVLFKLTPYQRPNTLLETAPPKP